MRTRVATDCCSSFWYSAVPAFGKPCLLCADGGLATASASSRSARVIGLPATVATASLGTPLPPLELSLLPPPPHPAATSTPAAATEASARRNPVIQKAPAPKVRLPD